MIFLINCVKIKKNNNYYQMKYKNLNNKHNILIKYVKIVFQIK